MSCIANTKKVQFDLDSNQMVEPSAKLQHKNVPVEDCWYDNSEFQLLKEECRTTSLLQRNGVRQRHCSDSYRGLEAKQIKERARQDARIYGSIQAVLVEQRRQHFMDIVDSDALAAQYQERTAEAVEAALKLAQQDEMDVRGKEFEIDDIEFCANEADTISILSDDDNVKAGRMRQKMFTPSRTRGRGLVKRMKSMMKKNRA